MLADPAIPIQRAAYATLTGEPFQTACGVAVGVYDHISEKAVAPYVCISDIQTDGDLAQRYDGSEVHANFVAWSTKPGMVEVGTIAEQVRVFMAPRSDLGPPFALAGHRLITWQFLQILRMLDSDGITSKASIRIRYLTAPTA